MKNENLGETEGRQEDVAGLGGGGGGAGAFRDFRCEGDLGLLQSHPTISAWYLELIGQQNEPSRPHPIISLRLNSQLPSRNVRRKINLHSLLPRNHQEHPRCNRLGVPQGCNSGPPAVCEETSISIGKLSRRGY